MRSKRERSWALVMTLYLLGIFMGAVDTGIITPARPIVAKDLGVDEAAGIWMITIYTLAYAAAIPIMGKLADRNGRKRVYLTSIVLFGVGSLLCGLSQDVGSFGMLIGARALQAIGGGGILPIATAEIGTEVPEEKRGMALGLVGGVYGIANIFGASIGSLILDVVGSHNWQWIFYVNVPIAIAIVAAGVFLLPDHRESQTKPIDALGTLLLVGIILSLLYGIRNLDFFNFGTSIRQTDVWPFLVGCLVALPLFVLAERRAADPVLNLRYFTHRGIALTLLLSLLSGVVLMAVVFVPQLAENALRIPSGKGGYFVIALGLASGIGAPLSGRLTDRFGAKFVLALGFGFSAVAAAAVVWWMIPQPSMVSVLSALFLIGLGLGFVVGSPLNYLMLERTPKAESASALGTLSLVRSVGTTLAPAIMVGFIAQGATGLQDALTAELPTKVTVPALPHAAELSQRIDRWKTDDRLKDKLTGLAMPDLETTEIEVTTSSGSGSLPPELEQRLRTADVTNIVERTQEVARYQFAQNTPQTIATIQSGVDQGIGGLKSGLAETETARADMTKGLTELDTKIADLDKAQSGVADGRAKMDAAIKEMESGIGGMDDGLATMKTKLDEMAAGIDEMDQGLDGLDQALAKIGEPIGGFTESLAGMDAGLKKQKDGLAAAKASGAGDKQLASLRAGIDQLQKKRQDAAAELEQLRQEQAKLKDQRSELATQRSKLDSGRNALKTERDKLKGQRDDLADQRATLVAERKTLIAKADELTSAREGVAKARTELASGRDQLDATRAELQLSVDQLTELRAAVPGAFDQALASYLAEIDARAPRLQDAFATGLASGFRGVYLVDLVACVLALGLLAVLPKRRPGRRAASAEADPDEADAALDHRIA